MPSPLLQRALDAWALVPASLRIGGGLGGTAFRALRLLRREGWDGIRRGLRIARSTLPNGAVPGSGGYNRNDYTEWLRRYGGISDAQRAALRAHAAALPTQPLISVLLPVYNADPDWLAQTIASVRAQIYPHWELCIADDASTDAALRPLLEHQAAADPRIRLVFRERNGHISAATNSALALAWGAWVALLDHDDLLTEDALLHVADAISRRPQMRMIYSDEDKIDAQGRRFDPYFKPDWNPDLFHSQNVLSHLGVYQAALVRELGGLREGFEGAQDYDLALRCAEHLEPAQIHHIPHVLYHWRAHHQSTAAADAAKPYAWAAGERALGEHFARLNVAAKIRRAGIHYKADYPLPEAPPLVSLIIPTRNALHLLRPCIASVLDRTRYANYEILVVDNGSDDPATLDYLRKIEADSRVRVLRDARPFNFSALNNAAVRSARGELVGLLNNDIEVIAPDWLAEMASHALLPGVGAVGARLLFPDQTLQHAGVVLGIGGCAGHAQRGLAAGERGYFGRATLTHTAAAVTGACLVIRKAIYEQVGGLDEENLAIAFNDVDFCLRVRAAGYRNVVVPAAELYHHESATRGLDTAPEKRARFRAEVRHMVRTWGDALYTDPCYNPNLSLLHEDFSLAWPPRVDLLETGDTAPDDAGFSESAYLTAHPQIAEAVARGTYASGWAHYQAVGRAQGLPLDLGGRMLTE